MTAGAASAALGRAGILDDYFHTSNDLNFLKMFCPEYKAESNYRDLPAVAERNLITASGTAPLEFAYEILKRLDVFSSEVLEAWYKLYQTHDSKYYYKLMGARSSGPKL